MWPRSVCIFPAIFVHNQIMTLPPSENPRVLLTVRCNHILFPLADIDAQNDDGPPDDRESPFILGLYRHLTDVLGMSNILLLMDSN